MTDDEHLGDGASVALCARERFVVDHHVGGERVERRGVGVDQHRVGGAYRLQVYARLAGNVELIEEAHDEVFGPPAPASDAGSSERRTSPTSSAKELAT